MSQNVTKSNKNSQNNENGLSVKQKNAIDLIVAGETDKEVAESVGVARETVNRWRNKDPGFVRELRKKRKQVWGFQEDRIRGLVSEAVNILADNLESESEKVRQKAAVHILKAVGLYGSDMSPDGPDSEALKQVRTEESLSLDPW